MEIKFTLKEVAKLFEKYYNKMPGEFNHLRVGDPAMTMRLMLEQLDRILGEHGNK